MKDSVNLSGKVPVTPPPQSFPAADNLTDAPFDAQKLVNEIVNPPEPFELSQPVDPWTLPTQIGIAEEMAPVAVEVGGAGTGTWVWVSALAASNPIAAGILAIIALSAVVGTFWWAESTPHNSPLTEIDALGKLTPNPRLEIANNPLPDNPQPFLDATKATPANSEKKSDSSLTIGPFGQGNLNGNWSSADTNITFKNTGPNVFSMKLDAGNDPSSGDYWSQVSSTSPGVYTARRNPPRGEGPSGEEFCNSIVMTIRFIGENTISVLYVLSPYPETNCGANGTGTVEATFRRVR